MLLAIIFVGVEEEEEDDDSQKMTRSAMKSFRWIVNTSLDKHVRICSQKILTHSHKLK